MTFSCIIVDDDFFAVQQLEKYISELPFLSIVKSYTDPQQALKYIEALEKPIDFLFTDIEMPSLSGLELARKVKNKVRILVLVSGYQGYALEGYHVNARAFLTKPFNFREFENDINRLIRILNDENPFIVIRLGKNQNTKVYINDIIAIEGNGNYINVHTMNGILVPYQKLSTLEGKLNYYRNFIRVSKSFIISVKHIEKREGYTLLLKNELLVNITESYRKGFQLKFK